MTVAHRRTRSVRLRPRADGRGALLLHQRLQYAEPNADREREQPFLGCTGELAECRCDSLRQHLPSSLIPGSDLNGV